MVDGCRVSAKDAALLDELHGVLDRLVKLTRQGGSAELEPLSQYAGTLVKRIAALGILSCPEFDRQRRELSAVYDTLLAELTARRSETADQLAWIRQGKRTLKAYRASM